MIRVVVKDSYRLCSQELSVFINLLSSFTKIEEKTTTLMRLISRTAIVMP